MVYNVDGVVPVNPVYHVAGYLPNHEPDMNTLSQSRIKKNEMNKKRFHACQGMNKHLLIDQGEWNMLSLFAIPVP